MQDFSDSGALVQDADIVLLLYRDEYYYLDTEYKNIAEIIVAKNRGGKIRSIELFELLEYCKFVNFEHRWE